GRLLGRRPPLRAPAGPRRDRRRHRRYLHGNASGPGQCALRRAEHGEVRGYGTPARHPQGIRQARQSAVMLKKLRKHVYNIIILRFLGIARWQAFDPFLFDGEEVQQTRRDMRAISPAKLEEMLKNPAKKPSILFIYASWCSPCHETGQMLLRLSKAGELS